MNKMNRESWPTFTKKQLYKQELQQQWIAVQAYTIYATKTTSSYQ